MKASTTIILAATLTIMTSCSSNRDIIVKDGDIQPTLSETFKEQITEESVEQHIASWPTDAKKASEKVIKEFGIPQGVTEDMLEWNDTGIYHRTIVHKEGIPHNSPRPHTDLVEYFTIDQSRVCDRDKSKVESHASFPQ